jgi:hypothetical protein
MEDIFYTSYLYLKTEDRCKRYNNYQDCSEYTLNKLSGINHMYWFLYLQNSRLDKWPNTNYLEGNLNQYKINIELQELHYKYNMCSHKFYIPYMDNISKVRVLLSENILYCNNNNLCP